MRVDNGPGRKDPEEERREAELFARLPDPAAREELVERYRPLSEYLARRFSGRGEPVEDLAQVAAIGLLNAVDRFDPERGVKFTTFATATIVGELKRHLRDRGWTVRVPRRIQEISLQVGRAVAELQQRLGRSPTVSELARHCGLSVEEVLEGMGLGSAYTPLSLDTSGVEEDDDRTLGDQLGEDDPTLHTMDRWVSLAPLLESLPNRERRILYLRFYHGRTQREIAEELGISQMHVSRLLARTLRELRERTGGP